MTQPTSRQVEAMLRDLQTIRREAAWLEDRLCDLEVIAHSPDHRDTERVSTSHHGLSESPVLSELWLPVLRANMRATARALRRQAVELQAERFGLARFLGGPGVDGSLLGTLLEPGELVGARRAKARRDAKQGDLRWGEWEARVDRQPDEHFRGDAAS